MGRPSTSSWWSAVFSREPGRVVPVRPRGTRGRREFAQQSGPTLFHWPGKPKKRFGMRQEISQFIEESGMTKGEGRWGARKIEGLSFFLSLLPYPPPPARSLFSAFEIFALKKEEAVNILSLTLITAILIEIECGVTLKWDFDNWPLDKGWSEVKLAELGIKREFENWVECDFDICLFVQTKLHILGQSLRKGKLCHLHVENIDQSLTGRYSSSVGGNWKSGPKFTLTYTNTQTGKRRE